MTLIPNYISHDYWPSTSSSHVASMSSTSQIMFSAHKPFIYKSQRTVSTLNNMFTVWNDFRKNNSQVFIIVRALGTSNEVEYIEIRWVPTMAKKTLNTRTSIDLYWIYVSNIWRWPEKKNLVLFIYTNVNSLWSLIYI